MPDREQATQTAVEMLSKFAGYNSSVEQVEQMLNGLSDEQFDRYMQQLRDGEQIIPYIAPNLQDINLSSETNLSIAEELGHEFFEQIWLTDSSTGETYLTPKKYLVIDLPVKRLQQHLQEKISIPEHNRSVDDRTGQVVGESKGATISFPELQVLYAQGLDETIRELFTIRGGNEQDFREYERQIMQTGQVSLDAVDDPDSRVRSTEVLSALLKAAHIENNL